MVRARRGKTESVPFKRLRGRSVIEDFGKIQISFVYHPCSSRPGRTRRCFTGSPVFLNPQAAECKLRCEDTEDLQRNYCNDYLNFTAGVSVHGQTIPGLCTVRLMPHVTRIMPGIVLVTVSRVLLTQRGGHRLARSRELGVFRRGPRGVEGNKLTKLLRELNWNKNCHHSGPGEFSTSLIGQFAIGISLPRYLALGMAGYDER
ncbi:hypothetical protein RRG08_058785 [Elysia crispata]|uniref:Uncharacterized protein n=1 Tax=Elysia crispata TaxID=231223 RepID=A0AAE0YX27_9GAST|nr:hypothetical protein RRG08_058785 [Elysia crispata]